MIGVVIWYKKRKYRIAKKVEPDTPTQNIEMNNDEITEKIDSASSDNNLIENEKEKDDLMNKGIEMVNDDDDDVNINAIKEEPKSIMIEMPDGQIMMAKVTAMSMNEIGDNVPKLILKNESSDKIEQLFTPHQVEGSPRNGNSTETNT
eukprot:160891_1